jgi:site-specific recombinase XerD
MDLLQNGVDRSVIALWLGHETLETVDVYVHANLQMKEQALAKTVPLGVPWKRYRPDDQLLAFLKTL